MRVAVAGATGRIGSRTVARLRDHGVEVVPVSRHHGVDVITRDGLDEALRGAEVLVDVTDAPARTEEAGLQFFRTATTNLLTAAVAAGVEHHVVLSTVGANWLWSDYFRAKLIQEDMVRNSPVPHSIVRATPFFESIEVMVKKNTYYDRVHVAPVLARPVSTDDVAVAVAHVAVGLPLFGILEVAGPDVRHLDDLAAEVLTARGDERLVVPDPQARYFGAELRERTLLPGADARLGHMSFTEWLAQPVVHTQG
ncbi:SDR family oxidoreductase [Streptomyces spongiae]|uniref:NAD-dependent epimerase/dehydratase family protein n=1 Tax=Streptomyces spongiae TaxID=565072 RepID=A0A5N8XA98_9ACTN|nr:NAD(P)H-binding protein [Streptomyces spongiae]MPY56066.1 NAD-dependent epimerase/dehydratase family protein [Streptomyces spongiae]